MWLTRNRGPRARVPYVLGWALTAAAVSAQTPGARPSTPSDDAIRQILAQRVDGLHQSVGIVVGVISPAGRRLVAYGALNQGDTRPLNGDTVFEIGSVSKVFTALLLSDMVKRGDVALSDPISKFLPAGTKVPQRSGREITLIDLATHTSGLPRLPTNLNPKDPNNPYADYTAAQLFAFLGSYELPRDIGSQFEYSNLGGGLLGYLLSQRAGIDYESLVRSRIAGPLGMTSTTITLSPEMKSRMANGHNEKLKPVANWEQGTSALAGMYALRSTANDLLAFLAANLAISSTPLESAMAAMLNVHRPTDMAGDTIGLGWLSRTNPAPEIIWHNGGTGGYRSWIGFDPKARVGVVVLSNAFTAAGVDDLGGHILDPTIDVLTARDLTPKEHKQVAVDPKVFDGYLGRYQMAPNFILTISRDGNHLFAQATGQGRFEIFAEGEKDYFAKIADIQITFQTAAEGHATGLVVHQSGADTSAKRIQ